MRLIDADACPALFDAEFQETKRLILAGEKHLDNLAEGFMETHNVIRSMPTIDAVPIVRCKDCKFRDGTPGQPNILCGQMKETDFCSYGEKAK